MAGAARRLRARLAEGEAGRREIDDLLGLGSAGTNGVNMWLDLVRVPPSGTWERRRADLYASAEEWIGPPDVEPPEARERVVRSYLRGFGPASRAQIANWAGLKVAEVSAALERLRLRSFRAEDGEELVDLPRAPLPNPDTPAPVRFLPVWDATLLAHARRSGILAEEHRPRVFNTRTPQSIATFLVDGAVAGTWRLERGRIELQPFGRLAPSVHRELDTEAARLAAFHA